MLIVNRSSRQSESTEIHTFLGFFNSKYLLKKWTFIGKHFALFFHSNFTHANFAIMTNIIISWILASTRTSIVIHIYHVAGKESLFRSASKIFSSFDFFSSFSFFIKKIRLYHINLIYKNTEHLFNFIVIID